MITAQAALWYLSLAAVSFWHQASSNLAAALLTEPRHFGLSMAYPSRSLELMWHHWRLALTVSLYLSFGLPWFLLPAWGALYIRYLGIQHSSIRITCPTHRSWALMMVASNAGGRCLIEDLQIGDVVLPPDSQDGAESSHVEEIQFLDVPAIQSLHLTTIEKEGKNHGIVDLQFLR